MPQLWDTLRLAGVLSQGWRAAEKVCRFRPAQESKPDFRRRRQKQYQLQITGVAKTRFMKQFEWLCRFRSEGHKSGRVRLKMFWWLTEKIIIRKRAIKNIFLSLMEFLVIVFIGINAHSLDFIDEISL